MVQWPRWTAEALNPLLTVLVSVRWQNWKILYLLRLRRALLGLPLAAALMLWGVTFILSQALYGWERVKLLCLKGKRELKKSGTPPSTSNQPLKYPSPEAAYLNRLRLSSSPKIWKATTAWLFGKLGNHPYFHVFWTAWPGRAFPNAELIRHIWACDVRSQPQVPQWK